MKISTKISIILLSLIFVGFFTVQAFGKELSAEQKQVWEVTKATWELSKKGETDIEEYKANFHKDLFCLSPKSLSPESSNSWARKWKHFVKVKSFELKPLEIKIFGNIAIVMYFYNYTDLWDNVFSGKSINIFLKEDGKLLLLSGMSSSCQISSRCP